MNKKLKAFLVSTPILVAGGSSKEIDGSLMIDIRSILVQ